LQILILTNLIVYFDLKIVMENVGLQSHTKL